MRVYVCVMHVYACAGMAWLTWNLLCRSGCPPAHTCPPILPSRVPDVLSHVRVVVRRAGVHRSGGAVTQHTEGTWVPSLVCMGLVKTEVEEIARG